MYRCYFCELINYVLSQNVRLSSELSNIEKALSSAERGKAEAERAVTDLQAKIEELEAMGARYLRNQVRKLEDKVRCWVFA